jgi:hypothetical protein
MGVEREEPSISTVLLSLKIRNITVFYLTISLKYIDYLTERVQILNASKRSNVGLL